MAGITWRASVDDHPARRAARASITAVTGGDKDTWLRLFAPDALVEDPVGPSFLDPSGAGHRGHAEIARFWDAVIGTAERIEFTIADSFANGDSCANVGTITTTMPGGSTMTVDLVMIYTVDEAGLITSLRAHWEPDRAMATITPS